MILDISKLQASTWKDDTPSATLESRNFWPSEVLEDCVFQLYVSELERHYTTSHPLVAFILLILFCFLKVLEASGGSFIVYTLYIQIYYIYIIYPWVILGV